MSWPGVTGPGTVNHDLVSNVDFAQTFLDAAGVDAPDDMHGRSLVPVLKGETPDDPSFFNADEVLMNLSGRIVRPDV